MSQSYGIHTLQRYLLVISYGVLVSVELKDFLDEEEERNERFS